MNLSHTQAESRETRRLEGSLQLTSQWGESSLLRLHCHLLIICTSQKWPDALVPNFKDTLLDFYNKCDALSQVVLKAMAIGLELPVCVQRLLRLCITETFHTGRWLLHQGSRPQTRWKFNDAALSSLSPLAPRWRHQFIVLSMSVHCTSLLKRIYCLVAEADVEKGQIRCGEHSDYGSITLLFQEKGIEVRVHYIMRLLFLMIELLWMQVMTPDGSWWSPPSVPGGVLVNVGDLMQRWTNDRLKSTVCIWSHFSLLNSNALWYKSSEWSHIHIQ
jgi:hypothetical protein